jgi:hypothetical protein
MKLEAGMVKLARLQRFSPETLRESLRAGA